MSDKPTFSNFDVLAQRLYLRAYRAYSGFFKSLPVSMWHRNSLRLNYLTPFLSDIDITFDCGDLSDLEVHQIQRRHNLVRRLFLRVGEANFYVRRHKSFIQKYANPLELARDPDLLGIYDIKTKVGPLNEAHKFVFTARSLNSDLRNLRKRPHWRLRKWNFHLRMLGLSEVLELEGRALTELLNQKVFSARSSLPFTEILNGLLNNSSKELAPQWIAEQRTSLAFFLLSPIQWLATVTNQFAFKRCLPQLTALNPFEQQVAFCHISWEISSLLTQFTWMSSPEQYNIHVKRLLQLGRFACPYYNAELTEDFLKFDHSSSMDLISDLEVETISPTYCRQAFAVLDIDTPGILRLCERDEDHLDNANLNSYSLRELRQRPSRLELHKAMLNGQRHSHCERCFQEEAITGISPRILSNDKTHPRKPTHARLKLGKSCELVCFKCSAGASSSWAEFFDKNENSESLNWYLKPEFWNDFKELLPELNKINLSGGDALSFEGHQLFLKQMIDSGHSGNIELSYHTNGQKDIRPFYDLWSRFKKVQIKFVLDGIEERNNYLRPPSIWSVVKENIQILDYSPDFIEGSISFAVHTLNAFYLLEDLRWLKNQSFKKINPVAIDRVLLMPQYTNDFRSLQACPEELKNQIETKLKIALHEDLVPEKEVLGLLGFMNSQNTFDGSALIRIQTLDKIHQTDFRKSLPEIAGYF